MSEDFKSNKNENKVNSDEMHQEQPSISSPQSYNAQQTTVHLINDYNELTKVHTIRMTQIEAEEIVEDVLKQAINTACDILEAGISWEKILKSSSQKRLMMGHTLKSSPILREPEPDFGDSTAPFQDNIFKLIFNLQVMGCLPHHFETLQSTNPQFHLQDNEQSIPSVIITEEKSSEHAIKKKLGNKSRITRHNPASDDFNSKLQGSSSENVPETPSEQSISDNEQMLYNDNGLPELLDSLEIPHCSYIKYQELKNNCSKECNDISSYPGNQNKIVDCEDQNNNCLTNKGLLTTNEVSYGCDNHKLNKNTGSWNVKDSGLTVEQGSLHEDACSETEKSSFDNTEIKTVLCKNSFDENSQDVSNELKLALQENNKFDVFQFYEPVSNSHNLNNLSGLHDNNSCIQSTELKCMADEKSTETVLNDFTVSHRSEGVNGLSSKQNNSRKETTICNTVSTELDFNQKHYDKLLSHNETANNEFVNSYDQHIVKTLETQLNKFEPGIGLRLLSNSQTLTSKQDFVTNISCMSNDNQSHQKSMYNSPIDTAYLPRTPENTNILNNHIDNIYRNHSSCEINDFNQINDSNHDKNSKSISDNALIPHDNLDKDECDDLKHSASIYNKCDENDNNNINNYDKNFHNDISECNILKVNLRDKIKIDEIPEIECDANEYNNNVEHYHDDNFACNTLNVILGDQININKILEINDDLKPLSSNSNYYNENDFNNIIANDENTDNNIKCNTLKVNLGDQINFDEELEIKQYCSDICHEIINHVFDYQCDNNDNKYFHNEILSNEHYGCDVEETITDNFNEIIAANVSNYFNDIIEDANKNMINDIKEFVHELKTLQNTLDQHEQQSIQANAMEDKLKDLQNIFNSDHESECDEQTPRIYEINPSRSSLNKSVIVENSNQQNLNEENNLHSTNVDIHMTDDNNCCNPNDNIDFITHGIWEDTKKDVVNENNLLKGPECQFRFYVENIIPLHSEAYNDSSIEIKSNNEINCDILQTNSSSGHNGLEESPFKLHTNFVDNYEGITLEQGHVKNTNEMEYVTRNNTEQEVITKSYGHENIEKMYEESDGAEQWLPMNCEIENVTQNSKINEIENHYATENESYLSMQKESDVIGLLQNRKILIMDLDSRSEKTDEENIHTFNFKHENLQDIPDSQYLDFNKFQGNNRKKWDIKYEGERTFNAFENADEEQPDIDIESNDSVGYYFNNNGLCDNLFSQNITLNDHAESPLFENSEDKINTHSFNEAKENNLNECLESFTCSRESETNQEQFSNLNPNSYPVYVNTCKHLDTEEWGEIQSYDYLEFIMDRINMKTSLMEHEPIDNIQEELLNDSMSDNKMKPKLNQESNQFNMKESEEESTKYFNYCLKKSDIVPTVNEHTSDCSKEFGYNNESQTEIKSPTVTSNMFMLDKEDENRNFKSENDSKVVQQNLGTNGKILENNVLIISEKDTKSRSKHFEVSKVSEDLQKESGLWTERNFNSSTESQSFHNLGTLHNSSVQKSSSAGIENVNHIEFSGNSTYADPNYHTNSEGNSQSNILGNLPIAANYINNRFLAVETSECNIAPSNKEVIVTNANARNTLKTEKNISTSQNQSFDMFWEYDGYYSKSYNEDFEAHKTSDDTADEKYKFYKEIFEKMIEEIGDIEKEQSSENGKAVHESNIDLNKVKESETLHQDLNCEPSKEKIKRDHGNLDVYNRSSSDKFSGSKVYWSSVGLVVENNDDPNTLPCCKQSDDNFETFMEETESGCVDLIYPEDNKNLEVDDKFGSTSDTAVNSKPDFIITKDDVQHINKHENCDELGEQVTLKVRKKNKLIQRIRSFFSSNMKVGTKVKKTTGDK